MQPVPLPHHTLPATRAGFKTRDNPYLNLIFTLLWPLVFPPGLLSFLPTKAMPVAVAAPGVENIGYWFVSCRFR